MSAAIQTVGDMDLMVQEWTPDQLIEAVEREKKMRSVIIGYFKSAMVQGHHYYNIGEGAGKKPALGKEGALNLCSLFKVVPTPDPPVETFLPDGHYICRSRTVLIGRMGAILATGDAMCSTKESKYAFRWAWDNELPAHLDKERLEKKTGKKSGGGEWAKYKVPNDDLADQYNTVMKMATKRSIVDAVLKLPLVSELFTQDLEEQINTRTTEAAGETKSRNNKSNGEAPANGKKANSELKDRALALSAKLRKEHGWQRFQNRHFGAKLRKEHDMGDDELVVMLPEGATFETLTEAQANEVVPKLVNALNAMLNAKRKPEAE